MDNYPRIEVRQEKDKYHGYVVLNKDGEEYPAAPSMDNETSARNEALSWARFMGYMK